MAAEPPDPDLSPEQRAEVVEILRRVVPAATVHIFGSRATRRARPFSDLDLLVVDPPRLGWDTLAELRDRFEASKLPFRVDLVELDTPRRPDARARAGRGSAAVAAPRGY